MSNCHLKLHIEIHLRKESKMRKELFLKNSFLRKEFSTSKAYIGLRKPILNAYCVMNDS